jgi:hypothetical protein
VPYLCTRWAMIPLEGPMATYIGRRRFMDDREAARLYKLAADQGNAYADFSKAVAENVAATSQGRA